MTGTIDILFHANHPDEPLPKHYVFKGSPSCPRIVNVPAKVGSWEIEDVYMSVTLPDGTMHTVDAICADGTFVATIPACDVVGVVEGGFQVICDGIDESGEAFEGLCLGCGDLEVLPRNGQIHVGETVRFFRIVDTVPATPQRCDSTVIGGTLKWYDGAQWIPFGNLEIDTSLSKPGQAADAKAVGEELAKKADEFSEWTFSGSAAEGHDVKVVESLHSEQFYYYTLLIDGVGIGSGVFSERQVELDFSDSSKFDPAANVIATRKRVLKTCGLILRKRLESPWTHNMGYPYNVMWGLDYRGAEGWCVMPGAGDGVSAVSIAKGDRDSTELTWSTSEWGAAGDQGEFVASRSVTPEEKLVTNSDISADNTAFAAAVEEIIRRQNNAQ